jgi:uncharacterized membrane protein
MTARVGALTHTSTQSSRSDFLDALRGSAIVWMIIFHFCFDLNHFRFINQNLLADPFWTIQRSCIVSIFLFCAGWGQAAAVAAQQDWPRFWRRWLCVAGCALLVSAISYPMFKQRFISFGVLHGMAVMLLIVRSTASAKGWLWLFGAIALCLPWFLSHPFFDTRLTNWVGLITHKPQTEDYVPVLPWLGVMWWGVAAGQWLNARWPDGLRRRLPAFFQPLVFLGRWPLTLYMLHQPIFMGLLAAIVWLKT